MKSENRYIAFFKRYLSDERVMATLWALIGVLSAVCKLSAGRHNNFLIFRGTFWHALEQLSLYAPYPEEYFDTNHYGPLFSLIIAPFALLPEGMGMILWNTALAMLLYWAVRQMRLTRYQHIFMLWFCAHELLTALFMQQFNVAIAAILLLSYAFVRDEKEQWATLAIVVGTLVKLYGIVGLAFFFLSKHKWSYILWMGVWSLLLFAAPMLLSSPEYVVSQYMEWAESLIGKGGENLFSEMQNISLLGIIRKTGYALSVGYSGLLAVMREGAPLADGIWARYSDLWVILPGILLFCLTYFRTSQWAYETYWLNILASVLMFVCLFSTGTESSGYIIALVGVVLWYTAAPKERSRIDTIGMVFAFLLTSMSPSDLFPHVVRKMVVQPFALKALPVAIIWIKQCWEMATWDYSGRTSPAKTIDI